jgi:hypothetical protein
MHSRFDWQEAPITALPPIEIGGPSTIETFDAFGELTETFSATPEVSRPSPSKPSTRKLNVADDFRGR